MKELFAKVATYIKTLSTTFLILETLLGLLVGGVVGALLGNPTNSSLLITLLVVSLPPFLALLCVKVFTQATFPAAAIEELRSRYELEEVNKDIARRRTIDKYTDAAIQSLNEQTCSLTPELVDELCERNIEDGLRSVIGSVIERPNYILDCRGSDFTIGTYLQYSTIPPVEDETELCWVEQVFILRDDLGLGTFFSPNLMYDVEATGVQFELRNALL